MASTREQLGELETFRRLVSGTIGTTFEEDSAVSVGAFALANSGIEHVVMPNVASLATDSFDGSAIRTIDIGGNLKHSSYQIADRTSLESVILRYPDVVSAGASIGYMLSGTRLAIAEGAVYVPDHLVERYDARVNGSAITPESRAEKMNARNYIAFRPISEYPCTDLSTIEGSWSDVMADINAGTYADRYHVGDMKLLELSDGTRVYMELVAIDADTLSSDGTSKAATSWLCHGVCPHRMRLDGTVGNEWPDTELHAWLEDELLPLFPAILRRNVKRVVKHYRVGQASDYKASNDVVWVPSVHEVMNNADYNSSPDVQYYASRARQAYRCSPDLDLLDFWSRDMSGNNYLYLSNGSYSASVYSGSPSKSERLIVFGFCL